MMNEEVMRKAKAAKSAEELIALAKENGIELDGKQAEEYFTSLNAAGELNDDELDAVAGGGCGSGKTVTCTYCFQTDVRECSSIQYFCNKCHRYFNVDLPLIPRI